MENRPDLMKKLEHEAIKAVPLNQTPPENGIDDDMPFAEREAQFEPGRKLRDAEREALFEKGRKLRDGEPTLR